jgi:hypothetical protein
MKKQLLADFVGLFGLSLIVTAAWMVYPPAAVAIGGAFLVLISLQLSK